MEPEKTIKSKEESKQLLNDRYLMIKKIGKGSYGSVYKVEDKKAESEK